MNRYLNMFIVNYFVSYPNYLGNPFYFVIFTNLFIIVILINFNDIIRLFYNIVCDNF